MSWSYKIARVAGIDVQIHATFLLLLAYLGYQGYEIGGPDAAYRQIIFVLLLFLCVLLHEFGHAFAARAYGIRTPDITLYPIGGVARLERMPENPGQELVIAIAGPLVNVVIALGLWLALGLPPVGLETSSPGMPAQLLQVNIMLVAFNLLPAFPMDGGRVLRALLAMGLGHTRATVIAARIGQVVAVLFGIYGVSTGNLFLVFIAMFIFAAAQQEARYAGLRAAVAGLRVGDAMITRFSSLPATTPLTTAAGEARQHPQAIYAVTDDHRRLAGIVSHNALLAAATTAAPGATVGSCAVAVPTLTPDDTFDDAILRMRESGSAVLPVVNPAGEIVGLVSQNLLRERAQR